ncbi:hypothetical protein OROMI_017165 [Orobanche minor]
MNQITVIDEIDLGPDYAAMPDTISKYNEHLYPTMGYVELLNLISLSEEFKDITVRQDEKLELADLAAQVPNQITECSEEASRKINILLQAYISQLKLKGPSLIADSVCISQISERLMRARFEIGLKKGWLNLSLKALKLCKMIDMRTWSGKNLSKFPQLNVVAHARPITHSVLKVELTITRDFQWDNKVHGYMEPFWIIVTDFDQEHILHNEYFMLKEQYKEEDHKVSFNVPIYKPRPPYCTILVSDKWLESVDVEAVPLRGPHIILPKKHPPPTELLHLQPLPVTALGNPAYETLYQQFKCFNYVQTRAFNKLYYSNDNVLVAAPTGSGKTMCAEFAILRNHREGPESMLAVYIAPVEALEKERYEDWNKKFGAGLGMRVVKFTGDTETDSRLFNKGQIIISTPEKWDAFSCRWYNRQHMQYICLFMVDELHLIGGQGGPVLEVVVSRMRFMNSQLKNRFRIVALSSSVANAEDLGEWIEATPHGLFNLCPNVRPVPLEVHIRGVNIANLEAAMPAMTRATYAAIMQHTKNGEPAIIYVPTRKHARLAAMDLMTYSSEESEQKLFLLQDLGPVVDNIKGPMLRETIQFGVGYLHQGLCTTNQDIVKTLFEACRIQVCVVSSSMCPGISLSARLVVVMGTLYYDCRENTCSNYAITDLQHMMGRAGRPRLDNSAKCIILCHGGHKEYYKKFLTEAFPVESHLHHYLQDYLNAEVAARVIRNMQDAVDCITWTFILAELQAHHFVEIKDDFSVASMLLGDIAAENYTSYKTIERFSSSLISKTKLNDLIESLAAATEYDEQLSIRPGDLELIRMLINHQSFSIGSSTNLKAYALLQAHLKRQIVDGDLLSEQEVVINYARRLVNAMIRVIDVDGCCLSVALLAMDLSKMLAQGVWENDSELLQLPHFTKELANRCKERKIETISSLEDMNFEQKQELLQLSNSQLLDISRFWNILPNMDLKYHVMPTVQCEEIIVVQVTLKRRVRWIEAGCLQQNERWWLVVGDRKENELLDLVGVDIQSELNVKLEFDAPAIAGKKSYTLYLKCDTFVGCDQQYTCDINVVEGL